MSFISLLLIALSLSTDCFAAALSKGTALHRPSLFDALLVGLLFGAFAALMPALGWAAGLSAREFVTEIDHWIALVLLAGIGGHMIWEALHPDAEEADSAGERRLFSWALVGTAFATSIDAAAIGITFAFLEVNILQAALVIGTVCGALAMLGVTLSRITGPMFGRKAEILGGIVLILIGIKIAVEHTIEQGYVF